MLPNKKQTEKKEFSGPTCSKVDLIKKPILDEFELSDNTGVEWQLALSAPVALAGVLKDELSFLNLPVAEGCANL